jgi:hypothetical protein
MNTRTEQREQSMISDESESHVFVPTHRAGWIAAFAVTLLVTAGCGGGGNSVKPQPQDPGAGAPSAANLVVIASASGTDTSPGVFETEFEAIVTDTTGAAISGATVAMTDDGGSVPLVEDSGTPGTYRATRAGNPTGTLTLDITAGSEQVLGATVTAPDLHVITSHHANDVVQASHPVHLAWSRAMVATEAVIVSKNYQGAPEADDGTKTIPTPGNPARNDQAFRVTRTNRAAVAEAAAGSTLEASVRNSVEPIMAQ